MRKTVQVLVFTACLGGCSSLPQGPSFPLRIGRPDYSHTVSYRGETLGTLALWYTGSFENWPLIRRHNKVDPKKLRKGMVIKIPAYLLYRRQPMPQEFIQQTNRRYAASRTVRSEKKQAPAGYSRASMSRTASAADEPEEPCGAGLGSEVLREQLMQALIECRQKQSGEKAE